MDDNKLVCNKCGADLREVGVWNKAIIEYKPYDSDSGNYFVTKNIEFDDAHGTYCGECNEEISSKVIELIDFEEIIL